MKNLGLLLVLSALIAGCGGKEKKEESSDGFQVNRTKEEAPKQTSSDGVPADLDNKGIGPVTSVDFGASVDADRAAKGEETFKSICTACHMADQRLIGPALKGVYERRSPEWVMNMILNPDGMLKEDPTAKALMAEYNNAIMLNQNLTEDQARAVAEYLRTL